MLYNILNNHYKIYSYCNEIFHNIINKLNKHKRFISIISSFVLFSSLLNANILSNKKLANSTPTHNIAFILDYHNAENINNTLNQEINENVQSIIPLGINAITHSAFAAFHDESGPIVINKSLWDNISSHHHIFSDFKTKSIDYLYNKYSQFIRFSNLNAIKSFKERCCYVEKAYNAVNREIKDIIKNDKSKNKKVLLDKIFNNNQIDSFNINYYLEVMFYLFADQVCKNIEKYTVKEINQDLYLFIPKRYISNLNVNIDKDSNLNDVNNLTNLELNIGLKVDHLKTLNIKDLFDYSKIIKQPNSVTRYDSKESFDEVLSKLFITLNEYKKYKGYKVPIWSIYADGHGLSSYSLKKEKRRFKKLYKYYKKQADDKKTTETDVNKSRKINNYNEDLLSKIKESILEIEKYQKSNQDPFQGTIISLPINQFKKLLKFFNENLNVGFYYYSSCYAGGEHLITPYKDNGKDLILNYPIAVSTLNDNAYQQDIPFMGLAPYAPHFMCPYNNEPEELIDINTGSLRLLTPVKLKSFFKCLEQNYHNDPKLLQELISQVNPYKTDQGISWIGNLPSIRPAYNKEFNLIYKDNKLIHCYDEKTLVAQKSINVSDKNILTISNRSDGIFLYSNNIKSKIVINRDKYIDNVPEIISMIPGEAIHKFEYIDVRKYHLEEFIAAFNNLPMYTGSKIFKIKELIIKETSELHKVLNFRNDTGKDYITLEDVILCYNVHDVNNITKMKKNLELYQPQSSELINGLWFSKDNNTYNVNLSNLSINKSNTRRKNIMLAYSNELEKSPIIA